MPFDCCQPIKITDSSETYTQDKESFNYISSFKFIDRKKRGAPTPGSNALKMHNQVKNI